MCLRDVGQDGNRGVLGAAHRGSTRWPPNLYGHNTQTGTMDKTRTDRWNNKEREIEGQHSFIDVA
jgi:hypothetical protein